jgi:pyrroloquinoline quinone biosynthesis protein A
MDFRLSKTLLPPLLRCPLAQRILLPELSQANNSQQPLLEVDDMKWETPSYNDLRFGFEVTMYIYNR